MRNWKALVVAVLGMTIACGGGKGGGGAGGVPGSTRIVDLNDTQEQNVCVELVDILGPMRTVDCGGGQTRTVGGDDPAECVAAFDSVQANAPGCPITVAQFTDCVEAIAGQSDAEICAEAFPAECAPLMSAECSGSGSGGGSPAGGSPPRGGVWGR